MSKKKNKKFKKKNTTIVTSLTQTPVTKPIEEEPNELTSKNDNVDTTITEEDPELNTRYSYVKKDVLKISTIFGLLVIIFVGLFVIKSQTSWLASFGDWIYNISGIQIQ